MGGGESAIVGDNVHSMSLLSLNLNLGLRWAPGVIGCMFNDNTVFRFDPTTPPSTAQWWASFDASPTSLPSKYTALQVLANGGLWTIVWTVCTPNITVTPPTGVVTLLQTMNAIYQSTLQSISTTQYTQITGLTWTSPAGKQLTLGQALNDNVAQYGANACTFTGLAIIAPGILGITF